MMTRAEIASLEAYPLRFDLPDDLFGSEPLAVIKIEED